MLGLDRKTVMIPIGIPDKLVFNYLTYLTYISTI